MDNVLCPFTITFASCNFNLLVFVNFSMATINYNGYYDAIISELRHSY